MMAVMYVVINQNAQAQSLRGSPEHPSAGLMYLQVQGSPQMTQSWTSSNRKLKMTCQDEIGKRKTEMQELTQWQNQHIKW